MTAETELRAVLAQQEEVMKHGHLNEILALYDRDAVIVEKGKMVHYGRDDLAKFFKQWHDMYGKFTAENTDQHFEGGGDWLCWRARTAMHSEKAGEHEMRVCQLWHRCADQRYRIMHDEYEWLC